MSFEVDRYLSAWAHIALCADLTWASEPPDEFIIANQRLWAQHCRVSQVLQDSSTDSQPSQSSNQCETEKHSTSSTSQDNSGCSRKSVKDVIPESRLAQFYGNFYYDEAREKAYANASEDPSCHGYNGQCENSDLTECWMLPEVEYWFRKLLDDPPERASSRRRRLVPNDDLERWGRAHAGEEAALTARVLSVRGLWAPRAPSPPPAPRKMRARRRQPRRLLPRTPAPSFSRAPALLCDPACKFDVPQPPQLLQCQRYGRVGAGVQVAVRASTLRTAPYRGTSVSRYAPTTTRPRGQERRVVLPRERPCAVNRQVKIIEPKDVQVEKEPEKTKNETQEEEPRAEERNESPPVKEKVVIDDQLPTTSTATMDLGLMKKRLYSTVLSMSAPSPINLASVGSVRLTQSFTPALLKLNPKIVAARIRPVVDNKFEELEKEALEQYKASDESIDTKFRELEKQAVDQYSTSNSNTSCSSGQSSEKPSTTPTIPESPTNRAAKFHKEIDSVTSQNFLDLNSKGQTASVTNLKNFHTPPRGEKKEQTHRPSKLRSLKSMRSATDTDYEAREFKSTKSPRWGHAIPPKKRHLTLCVSDVSDEEMEDTAGSIKDAPMKSHLGKMKLSAHGGGDLIMRKT